MCGSDYLALLTLYFLYVNVYNRLQTKYFKQLNQCNKVIFWRVGLRLACCSCPTLFCSTAVFYIYFSHKKTNKKIKKNIVVTKNIITNLEDKGFTIHFRWCTLSVKHVSMLNHIEFPYVCCIITTELAFAQDCTH